MLQVEEEVKVFRVEHADTGQGPYREEFYEELEEMHIEHCGEQHPAPSKDGMGDEYDYGYKLFGFKDLEQLDNWFEPKFRQILQNLGFIIRIYRAPVSTMVYGGRQVAFDADVSTLCDQKILFEEPLVSAS